MEKKGRRGTCSTNKNSFSRPWNTTVMSVTVIQASVGCEG